MRRIAILAEGAFEWHYGKTGIGVIRYGKEPVVAVIDSTRAGQDVSQALNASFGQGIPVVRDIHEALANQPNTLLIGIAPIGGALPTTWRWQLLAAIEAGLDIISGLHMFLADDEELRVAAAKRGVTIWDVRRPPDKNRVAEFIPHRPGSHTVLMVGSDCAVGKPPHSNAYLTLVDGNQDYVVTFWLLSVVYYKRLNRELDVGETSCGHNPPYWASQSSRD